jgi:predicted DNA-binding transcriptional regulator YafY
MQVNRLFEIVYILLNKNYITAKELAEHFEVSSRTIYRDVEVLCQSGIPIYTNKGKGGGIGLLDNFVLNKSLLSKGEQQEILSALQSLSATNYPDNNQVLAKLNNLFGTEQTNWIEVDFSDWSNSQKEKFLMIKTAVLHRKVLNFDYFNRFGEKLNRTVEPVQLMFKDKNWYLKAYCRSRLDYRVFKLNRMKNIISTEESFSRELPKEVDKLAEKAFEANVVLIRMKVDESQAYRVFDEFEENQITKKEDGSFIVDFAYAEDEWVYGYILSFGYFAEVLEPTYIREIIKHKLEKTLTKYQ